MEIIQTILTIILVLVSLALIVLVLMQEGKSGGLGAGLAGASSDSYVSRNYGNTPEGKMAKWTKILGAAFMVIALLINVIEAAA